MAAATKPLALDRRSVAWGLIGVAVTLAIAFVGSDGLLWFDAALIGYFFGVLFLVFGVLYRYSVWLRRPPTSTAGSRTASSDRPPSFAPRRMPHPASASA